MASKAVAKVKADWSGIIAQVTPKEVPKVNKLKSIVESNAIKVTNLPASLPQIDWAFYKANASDSKMVEELERKYLSIKLEPPKAPASRLEDLKRAQAEDQARYKKFSVIAQSYIDSAEVVKKKFMDMIPVKDMSMEDWALTFPHWSTTIDNPSLAPHWGRAPGLSREEAAAFDQPDPVPWATPTAWKEWEEKKKKFYS